MLTLEQAINAFCPGSPQENDCPPANKSGGGADKRKAARVVSKIHSALTAVNKEFYATRAQKEQELGFTLAPPTEVYWNDISGKLTSADLKQLVESGVLEARSTPLGTLVKVKGLPEDYYKPTTTNAFCPGEGARDNSCPPANKGTGEAAYRVGKAIRERREIPRKDWEALSAEDRAKFEELKKEYKPRPEKTKGNPELTIKRKVGNIELVEGKFSNTQDPDEYVYHVTTKDRADAILRTGFKSGQAQSMAEGFYREYSQGKTFFADRPGVSFWMDRISDHLQAQTDEEVPLLVVLRTPKDKITGLARDELGEQDSRAGAYFVRNARPTKPRKPNPLRADPTRTASLRRRFETDLNKRFKELKRRIAKLVLEEDALGLKEMSHDPFALNAFCPGEGARDNSCPPANKGTGDGGGSGEYQYGDEVPPHDSWKSIEPDSKYVYHATNLDNVEDIKRGSLVPHKPWHGTDQREWPDGSTKSRSYFTKSPATAWMFAPAEGKPALLRTRTSKHFKMESGTQDIYLEGKQILPSRIEILTSSGWKPLKVKEEGPVANTKDGLMDYDDLTANQRWRFPHISYSVRSNLTSNFLTVNAQFALNSDNCGTGAGGFQPGNTCAKGGGGGDGGMGSSERESLNLDTDERKNIADKGLMLHGTSRKFSSFKHGGHQAVYLSDPSDNPDRVTQAEHIADGGFGGRLLVVEMDRSQLKKFDPYNDEVALAILQDVVGKRDSKRIPYEDMPQIVERASKHGYNLFNVYEPAIQGYSWAVTKPEALRVKEEIIKKGATLNARWRFLSSDQKLKSFVRWLKTNIQDLFLPDEEPTNADAWYEKYAEEGFKKGAGRSFQDVMKKRGLKPGVDAEYQFLRESFAQPVAIEKIKLLASRVFTTLKNVTSKMAANIGRVLTDGLVQGKGARELTKDLIDQVDLGRTQAEAVARTEIIRAHGEGQLEAIERMGFTHVTALVEWSTALDNAVCPKCKPLEGVVLPIDKARNLIPRHVSCRCGWKPAGLGESTNGQKLTNPQLRSAFEESLEADSENTSWAGADLSFNALIDLESALNAFCPTGEGGGQDNSCPPANKGEGGDVEVDKTVREKRLNELADQALAHLKLVENPEPDNIYGSMSDTELGDVHGRFATQVSRMTKSVKELKDKPAMGPAYEQSLKDLANFEPRFEKADKELKRRIELARVKQQIVAIHRSMTHDKLVMTQEDVTRVMSKPGDVYVDAKLKKDHGRYPYTPELFKVSDLSGAKVRHYVVLPDGRIAHPDEIHKFRSRGRVDIIPSAESAGNFATAIIAVQLARKHREQTTNMDRPSFNALIDLESALDQLGE